MKKRKKIKLTEPEKQTLLEMYRNHSKSRMKERAHMVLLSNDCYSIKEICSIDIIGNKHQGGLHKETITKRGQTYFGN